NDLLKAVGVHKVESAVVLIKELVGPAFDADRVNAIPGIPGMLDGSVIVYALHLCPDFGGRPCGFVLPKFDDRVQIAVEFKNESVANVCCCRHKYALVQAAK